MTVVHSRLCQLAVLASLLVLQGEHLGASPAASDGPSPSLAVAPHPRILLTPALVNQLKAKAAAGDAAWKSVKSDADKYASAPVSSYCRSGCGVSGSIVYSYEGSGWLAAIQPLAMAYQVTGNAAYASKVIEVMNAANATFAAGNLEPITTDSGYPSRSAAFGLALAFDWVYDRLDAATKTATVNTLNGWFDWMKASGYQKSGPAYGNYFGGHLLGFGVAGYATAGDNPRSDEIIAYMRSLFDTLVPPAFTTGGSAGGYPVESFNYGPNHMIRLFQYMSAVRSATGADIPGAVTYAKACAVSLLYNLKPNRWQVTDEGDFPGSYTGVLPAGYTLFLAWMLDGTQEGAWMQYLYGNLGSPPASVGTLTANSFDKMLNADSSRASADYRTVSPTFYRSPGDEHLYVRSSWNDDAVWASFAAGAALWGDHEMKKAGHIAIQRGNDYLLVNSGQWKGLTGVGGSPDAFDIASWRGNTLYFYDLGEYMSTGATYAGGQGYWGLNRVLAFEVGTSFTYEKSDLTDAYDKRQDSRNANLRSLRFFHRNFVYLRPGFFVVFDRVKALKSTYTKKLYWHLNPVSGAPTVSGNLVTSTAGSSSLLLKTLLPATPVITIANDPVDSSNPARITYRAEVSDSATGTDVNFLTAIAATAAGGSMPDTSAITVTGGKMAGALIKDAIPRVVLFALDGTQQAQVTYLTDYSSGVTGQHLLVDMAPGTYNVFRDGTKILSGVPASANGVVYFEAAGGSMFTVTTASSLPNVLLKSAGDQQAGPAGSTLPTPLTVKLADGAGNPIPGIPITFAVTGGSATLSTTAVNTDASGLAATTVTFKTAAGPVAVQASGLGYSVQFSLTAQAGPAAALTIVSGNNQNGVVSSSLSTPLSVKLADSFGNGINNQAVSFTITAGGGSVGSASVSTDVNGLASTTRVLGPSVGVNTVVASAAALPGVSVTFTANATGGAAKSVTVVGGDNQTGVVSTTLPLPLVVKVVDVGNNPISGVTVTWAIASGSATFSTPAVLPTDAQGQAQVSVKFGSAPGSVSITATVSGIAPATFKATAVAGGAANLEIISGNNQTGTVGQALAAAFVVRVTDSSSNAVPGVSVTFQVTGGGGALSPAQPSITDAQGKASATLTLPQTAGPITVLASAAGAAASLSFSATARVDAAAQLSVFSGNNQTGPTGKALVQPFVVQVKDQYGNAVSGYSVTFAVSGGGGTLSASPVLSDSSGKASSVLTLGPAAGTNTVAASAGSLAGSPVTFTATAAASAPTQIKVVSGDSQTGTPGQTLPASLVVRLLDAGGNPVPGLGVNFSVASGGASLTTAALVMTDSQGNAPTGLKLGTTAGSGSVSASAAGLAPVAFSYTTTCGPAAKIAVIGGDRQTDFVGATLKQPLAVKVSDAFGNGVPGTAVVFAVTSGSGTLAPGSSVTAADGTASTALTLGANAGDVTVTASAGALTTSFTATANAKVLIPAALSVVSGDSQTGTVGQVLPAPLVVRVTDASGTPVSGVKITFQTTAGALAPAQPMVSDAQGLASASLTLPQSPGNITVSASVTGIAAPAVFSVVAKAGAATQLVIVSGNNQTGTAANGLPASLVVGVRDAFGNAVSGFNVTFAVTTGGGVLQAAQAITDAQGNASARLFLGPAAGTNTITAMAASLAGSPATFTETGIAAAASQIVIVSGNNQSGVVGQVLAAPLVVALQDAQGNPVPGLTVNFSVTAGGGSLTTVSQVSNAQGQASANVQLGPTPGRNTVTAAIAGVPAVTFTATAAAGPPAKITVVSGDNQAQLTGGTLPLPLVVKVTDSFANSLSGVAVSFAVTTGSATPSPANATTAADGTASTSLALGNVPGDIVVTASAGSATARFTATARIQTAANLAIVSGNDQSGVVGVPLAAPLIVRVTDASAAPVPGAKVTFLATAGVLALATVSTDAQGLASGTLTLPQAAGKITVTAAVAGVASAVSFNVTANADAAAQLVVLSGNNQTATVATALPTALVVAVRDRYGNPISGLPVSFSVTSGGASLSVARISTDAQGLASTQVTLGTAVGEAVVVAAAGDLAGSPATFRETGVAASAAKLVIVSGNNQMGTAGQALASPLVVALSDGTGNPLAGMTVNFSVDTGGGRVVAVLPTNAAGQASGVWQLGPAPGPNTVMASVTGVPPVTFSATGASAPPASVAVISGDAQTQLAGLAFPSGLTVRVIDAAGNKLPSVAVSFSVVAGSGTVAPATALTDADGTAATMLTAGQSAGNITVRAVAGSVSVQFNETAAAPALPVASVPSLIRYFSGDGQKGTVGTDVQPLQVIVTDTAQAPVANLAVEFQVIAGNGTLSAQLSITDARGLASAAFRLGTQAGSNQVIASVPRVTGSPVVFTLTGLAGSAARLEKLSGDNQIASVNTPFGQPLAMRVTDAYSNPLENVAVTFSLTQGDALLGATSAKTDSLGMVSVAVRAGRTAGAVQVAASAAGVATPVLFSATLMAAGANVLKIVSGNDQAGVVGASLPNPLVVSLADAGGKALPGVQISFSVDGGKAVVQNPIVTTDSNGMASANVQLGTVSGPILIWATLAVERVAVAFTATAKPGAPAAIAVIAGDAQAGIAGQVLPQAVTVKVVDQFGNPTAATVVFQAEPGQATFSPTRGQTDDAGTVRVTVTLGSAAAGTLRLIAQVENTSLTAPINVNAQQVPFITGIVNPASYWDPNPTNPQLAANSMFTIFGKDLADSTAQAGTVPLPTSLAGTSVDVAGLPASLLYVSPTQINAISPSGLADLQTSDVLIVVRRGSTRSAGTFYRLVPATPGLFTADATGSGAVAALRPDYSSITPLNPARRGETIAIYATGLGPVMPPVAAGQPGPLSPLSTTVSVPVVTIGGVNVAVIFSGLAPGFVGLFQINLLIGGDVPTGPAVPIVLVIDGQRSNTATIAISAP